MLIRVRTNVGLWRVDNLSPNATASDVLDGIARTRPNVKYEKPLCFDPKYDSPIDTNLPLSSQNISHGSMIHTKVDPTTCLETAPSSGAAAASSSSTGGAPSATVTKQRRVIEDGTIKLVSDDVTANGFRKGMLALRDMKMAWTLNEFMAMDSQYVFKIKLQDESWVPGGVSLDTPSCEDFQRYLSQFQFLRSRCGYLYGRYDEEGKKVVVECIYEPPQVANPDDPMGFELLDDENEEKVKKLAEMLGLKPVGWIFGHPPRDKAIQLTTAEILFAAELQLEAADGVSETSFTTVKVTCGVDGHVSFEAFQVSLQCMEMVAEEALEIDEEDPKVFKVNDTFTAIQEGKESKTVDTNFFLTVVPIHQHVSEKFICQFPKANRDGVVQTMDDMKRQLSKSGKDGWTFIDLMSDIALLGFLCQFLDFESDIPKICESIVNRDIPLENGYKIIIASMAGMDGSY
mmetsp:Transcript_693/g.932  ORF Transcript_693/g.932 Transcript_693/m.932 type:complete len:459 (-) Transcript_693:131-1507(-)|eukprot:CAMPEP_0172512568 /NCGR_PEP_ID=MMETSP1066-20121228/245640_1 /TAXON_ID=671091 /ORGANISM="Coscinodiscus wailesii, Strain CCMP2513" /LENGTH=458 /DNA_ID=CAMNT_0013292451 /DNA_START=52 /DNA_END=1428 /DNA_ORIENTATION=-